MAQISKTQQELNKIPLKQLEYLSRLRDMMRHFYQDGFLSAAEQYKDTARGYIKCLDDCGIASFRIMWAWFTL